MNRKAKGTKGERELVKFFNESGWACLRAPGSGSSRYPSPDIIAANAIRRIAIECKVTKNNKKYFQGIHPERVLDYLKEKEDKYRLILPDLIKHIGIPHEETSVEVFKGKFILRINIQYAFINSLGLVYFAIIFSAKF